MSDIETKVSKNSDGTVTFSTHQEVGDILDRNQLEYNENLNRSNKDTFGRKVASVPMNILNAWCKEWGITFHQLSSDPAMKLKMMQRLRDPQYRKLRTDSGRI